MKIWDYLQSPWFSLHLKCRRVAHYSKIYENKVQFKKVKAYLPHLYCSSYLPEIMMLYKMTQQKCFKNPYCLFGFHFIYYAGFFYISFHIFFIPDECPGLSQNKLWHAIFLSSTTFSIFRIYWQLLLSTATPDGDM